MRGASKSIYDANRLGNVGGGWVWENQNREDNHDPLIGSDGVMDYV